MPSFNSGADILIGTRTTGADPSLKFNKYTYTVEAWDIDVAYNVMTNISVDGLDRAYFSTLNMEPGTANLLGGIYCILSDQTTAWYYPTEMIVPLTPAIADEKLLVCVLTEGWFATGTKSKLIGIREN